MSMGERPSGTQSKPGLAMADPHGPRAGPAGAVLHSRSCRRNFNVTLYIFKLLMSWEDRVEKELACPELFGRCNDLLDVVADSYETD